MWRPWKPTRLIWSTNSPHAIDPALLRPGRLEHVIFVPPPTCAARESILSRRLHRMLLRPGLVVDELAKDLAHRTSGFTGADISSLCQQAAMSAMARAGSHPDLNEQQFCVDRHDFEQVLLKLQPSVTPKMLQGLASWAATKGSSG
jgi:AAA family ATPase